MIKKFLWFILIGTFLSGCSCNRTEWYNPTDSEILIAHALGGIDGVIYTNSKEAFLLNYELGKRWFEVDMHLTKDNDLVCFHNNHEQKIGLVDKKVNQITTKAFLSHKYQGKYTLLTFEQLLELIKDKKDVFIITDTKGWSRTKMDALLWHIDKVDSALISRIIPQIYFPEDMTLIEETENKRGKFASLIFTLYATTMPDNLVVCFIRNTKIPIVTMPTNRVNDTFIKNLHEVNSYLFTHTINSKEEIEQYKKQGIDGFYTDFYVPSNGFKISLQANFGHFVKKFLAKRA